MQALKEMVFLPLVYPELFERFKITPPRGVLFYGPPGGWVEVGCLIGRVGGWAGGWVGGWVQGWVGGCRVG